MTVLAVISVLSLFALPIALTGWLFAHRRAERWYKKANEVLDSAIARERTTREDLKQLRVQVERARM